MIQRRWLVLLFSMLLVGCAGARPARELSRETLGQVVEYEQQVLATSRILQAYYRRALIEISEDYDRMQNTAEVTSRGIAAEDAVDQLLKDGYSARHLRNYLTAVADATAADRARYAALRVKLGTTQAQAVKEVAIEEATLKAMRAKLEFLQREPSLRDRAAQIAPLIEAAVKSIQNVKPTK